jgi:hypothetical protein
MGRRSCYVVSVSLVAVLLLAGCKKMGEKAAEKAAEKAIESSMAKDGVKANVDLSKDKMTIETKDGTTTVAGGKGTKLPDNFPPDVFVCEGAITTAITVPDGFSVLVESGDASDKVVAAIKAKMTGSGWKEELSMIQGNHATAVYKKGERTATYSVTTSPKGSQVGIVTVQEKGSKGSK